MSGPLSRLHSLSELLPMREDEDSIPWTYVASTVDSTQGDAVMYTSEGLANKRRKIYRKKKRDFDVGPSSDPNPLDWTEEEELSLCQAVALCLQQTQTNSSKGQETEADPSTASEYEHAQALLSTNITTELQRLSISNFLTECFVPCREYGGVMARVRSGAFRRTFIGFLQAKARRSQSLLCTDSVEEVNAKTRSDSSAESKETLQVAGKRDRKSASFTEPEKCPSTSGRPGKVRSDEQKQPSPSQTQQSIWTDSDKSNSAKMNVESRIECSNTEPVRGMQEAEIPQEQTISENMRTENVQPPNGSSSRLKNKSHCEVHSNSDGATSDGDRTSVRQISPDSTDDKGDVSKGTLYDSPNSQCRNEDKKSRLKEESEATETKINQLSTRPTKPGKVKIQKQKRKQKTAVQIECTELEQRSDKVLAKVNHKTSRNTRSKKFSVENVQKVECAQIQIEESCHERTKTANSQASRSGKVRLLATVQPIRNSQSVKEIEKRSFKTFRKKFLDRCLEVQHSGLALTAKIPGRRCSESSQVHANLDECLALQQVQQTRKSLLDACLLAQRDVS